MDAETLHRAMLRIGTYRGEVGPVDYHETHISRLYLTRDHVYKVKKAVDFGFLDFTTLDRRRFYCGEEVRLNRRFCPGTYLGVDELRAAGGRVSLGGSGETVEYAVRMKRLPEARMLDRLLETGAPGLAVEMERLGRTLARHHREAPPCRNDGGVSDLERVRGNWQENFAQTSPYTGKTLSEQAQRLCADHVERFLATHAGLLREREDLGYVREGHGDLHAEHICLTEPLRIYDCIEFNRRLRVADLAADLAFLLMDLDYRCRPDLAAALLNAYRSEGGTGPGTELLLPFYKIYRAWVRGKVESFLAVEPAVSPLLRETSEKRARRYFDQAIGYLCPPALVLTCGLMGVGKSAVAAALAQRTGALLLRTDALRKEFGGAAEGREAAYGSGLYAPEVTSRTYALLGEQTAAALAEGRTVIADASFSKTEERERFRRIASTAGVPVLTLFMHCDEETALLRLDQRWSYGDDPSDGRRELYPRQAAVFETPSPGQDIIEVDTTRDVHYNVHFILCEIVQRLGEHS